MGQMKRNTKIFLQITILNGAHNKDCTTVLKLTYVAKNLKIIIKFGAFTEIKINWEMTALHKNAN